MGPRRAETVAIVIPCYEQKGFLASAIQSAINQTVRAEEVIVVDDGSNDDLSDVTSNFAGVQLISQRNRGLAGARNTGLKAATANKIVFLDADDRLLPSAIASGLDCFAANPDAAFVYGAFREVKGRSRSRTFSRAATHRDLVRCNWIGMVATVMFDRQKLLGIGGFDETLEMCEDWDAYLRLSRAHEFAAHPKIVADYVKHGANVSNNVPELRRWIEVVRQKEWKRGLDGEDRIAWEEGEELWRSTFESEAIRRSLIHRIGNRIELALRFGSRK